MFTRVLGLRGRSRRTSRRPIPTTTLDSVVPFRCPGTVRRLLSGRRAITRAQRGSTAIRPSAASTLQVRSTCSSGWVAPGRSKRM
jgi:hypothetical protein